MSNSQVYYQLQFLNLFNKFEDCVNGNSRELDEAISKYKKKKQLLNIPLRIIKISITEEEVYPAQDCLE